ncbi:Transcriptional regulatory protein TcrA [Candidatus Protofrankia californiensis]|uniref:Transcriptional regulatory protein TcrA n=1 Tax=Candidatus Protofrankia californiensis TaxID=1839754 RepID=A0A1C3PAZ5_9ACTN|nr:Transcriptional regulatory protein TcrA [Candidatus Protofrankia californiensis]
MRILIVEDEENLAAAIRDGLRHEGCAVDVADDGEQGLWLARSNTYDAIILDIMLPCLSGYAVTRSLRRARVWTPVLMLTAKDGEYDEADALDLGADDYLTKPFSFVVLLAHLRALIRRGTPGRPTVLTAGDLQLDPAQHRFSRAGTDIRLRPREFALMHYLMRHPGQVLPKSDITANVWDEFEESDPNLVEVYISYLRRKIDKPFGRQAIETVRGVGYRLRADGG